MICAAAAVSTCFLGNRRGTSDLLGSFIVANIFQGVLNNFQDM